MMTEIFASRIASALRQTIRALGIGPPITVWTDGAFDRTTQLGGWAAVVRAPGQDAVTLRGAEPDTKSTRMEVVAASAALEFLPPSSHVVVHTDDLTICYMAASKHPKYTKREDGALIKRLFDAIDLHESVTFRKVKGHSVPKQNEVDSLAKSAVREAAREWNIPLRPTYGLIPQGQPLPPQ